MEELHQNLMTLLLYPHKVVQWLITLLYTLILLTCVKKLQVLTVKDCLNDYTSVQSANNATSLPDHSVLLFTLSTKPDEDQDGCYQSELQNYRACNSDHNVNAGNGQGASFSENTSISKEYFYRYNVKFCSDKFLENNKFKQEILDMMEVIEQAQAFQKYIDEV